MPEILKFETVLDAEILKEKLKKDLPHRVIKPILFSPKFQVRKSNFTLQSIQVSVHHKRKTITLTSALDMIPLYILVCCPMALYIYIHREKHRILKQELIQKITEYHL